MIDTYKTIAKAVEGIYKDKGSKFIAFAYPIKTEQDARHNLEQIKALHSKARHHCWAYRLSPDKSVYRINDDGEPSGSAGRPILNVLLSEELTDIQVIVVRYFGGVLLGVPGLINAYKQSTIDAIQQANIVEKYLSDRFEVSYAYEDSNAIIRLLNKYNAEIVEQKFDLVCSTICAVRRGQSESFTNSVEELRLPSVKLNPVL